MRAGAIVLGAGKSQRLGQDKMLVPLLGRPLLAWLLEAISDSASLEQVVLVLNGENWAAVEKVAAAFAKVSCLCLGGERRQDSVREGLREVGGWEWGVIHDGARPCLTPDLVERGLEAAKETGAATAAVPVTDTIKRVADGVVESTPPRDKLWLAQTPQVFRRDIIDKAYAQPSPEVTDDASLVERLGYRVKVYMGSYANIKVTTEQDLAIAEAILRGRYGV